MKECRVLLEDIRLDKNLLFVDNTVMLNDRRNKFTCYICMAKFPTATQMAKHKSLHSGTESEQETEDDFFEEEKDERIIVKLKSPSSSAQKQISKKSNLNSSMTKHKHMKAAADVLPTSNAPASELQEKVSSEDIPVTPETPFKCETCQVFFKTGDDAKLHKPSNKCKFSCRICRRKFNTLYAFVVHVMQHKANLEKNRVSGHYSYTCSLCEKLFDDCYQLKRHENITHNIKPTNRTLSNADSTAPALEYFKQEENVNIMASQDGHEVASELQPNTDKVASELQPNTDKVTSELLSNADEVLSELHSNTSLGEDGEIICELCYDVFSTREELKCHVDFHKQLENKSDTIVIEDDEDDIVEVVEDKSNPLPAVTTTIKKSLPKTKSYSNIYATLTPLNFTSSSPKRKSKAKVGSRKTNRPILPNEALTGTITEAKVGPGKTDRPILPNQALTATITDMLTPTHEKQSKTILLKNSPSVPTLIPLHKVPSIPQTVTPESNDNLELRKTGPLSYSFIYTDNTKGSKSKYSKKSSVGKPPQVINSVIATESTNNAGTVSSLSNTIPTGTILNTNDTCRNTENVVENAKLSKIAPNNVNNKASYKFTIKSVSNANSAGTSNLVVNTTPQSNAQNTHLTQIVPSSIQNTSSNTSSVLPSTSGSNFVPNANFAAYVINPTNTPFSQISPSAPLTFTDPVTNIAYVIIPHGNKIHIPTSAAVITTTANNSNNNSETNTASVSTANSIPTEKLTHTVTTLVKNSNMESCMEPMVQSTDNASQHPPEVASLLSSQKDNQYDIQITNVTSLHEGTNYTENTVPMITNVTSIMSPDENRSNSSECVSLQNISTTTNTTTTTTTTNITSISSYMTSKPGPSNEAIDSTIVIDSDSSRDSKEDQSESTKVCKEKSGNDSDSNEAGLIIDESTVNKSDANDTPSTEPKPGLIFVRNISDLMEPQNKEKEGKETNQADQDKPETSDGTKPTEKKEKKWKFPMNCDGCSVVFQRYRAMRNHYERRLKCTICDFRCCKIVNLKEHYVIEHRKYFCGRCSFLADGSREFKKHNSKHHTCEYCKGLFANLSTHVCSAQKNTNESKNSNN